MTGATTAISHGITTIACRQMDECGHSSKTSWRKRLRAAKHREGDNFLNIIIRFNLGILERRQQDGWTSGQSSDEDIARLHHGPTVPTEPSNNHPLHTHTRTIKLPCCSPQRTHSLLLAASPFFQLSYINYAPPRLHMRNLRNGWRKKV